MGVTPHGCPGRSSESYLQVVEACVKVVLCQLQMPPSGVAYHSHGARVLTNPGLLPFLSQPHQPSINLLYAPSYRARRGNLRGGSPVGQKDDYLVSNPMLLALYDAVVSPSVKQGGGTDPAFPACELEPESALQGFFT